MWISAFEVFMGISPEPLRQKKKKKKNGCKNIQSKTNKITNQILPATPGKFGIVLYLEAYVDPCHIHNSGKNTDIFIIWSILRTLSNIYDKAFCKNG